MVIVAIFVVSEALVTTGWVPKMGQMVIQAEKGRKSRLLVLLTAASAGVGAFMSSTTAMAIFIPVALFVARSAELNSKRVLRPLSVGALISGMMTLIATPPHLVVTQVLVERAMAPMPFFSFTLFGLCILAVIVGFMLLAGRKMLAKAPNAHPATRGAPSRPFSTA